MSKQVSCEIKPFCSGNICNGDDDIKDDTVLSASSFDNSFTSNVVLVGDGG